MSRYCWLFVGWLAAGLTLPALAQVELLQNPGFEEVNAKGLPTAWGQYGGGVPESLLASDTRAHGGKQAVRFVDTGPNERDNRYAIGLSQDVPCEPGKLYVGSVWLKALARNHDQAVVLQLTFLGTDQNNARYLTPPLGGDWQRYSVGGVAPEGCTKLRFYLYTMHFWTSETLLDDASLIKMDGPGLGARASILQYGEIPLPAARPLNLRTPVVTGGQPAATIAAPADPQWQQLARDLQVGLKTRTGAELPICAPDQVKSLLTSDRTIIALGNLNNNFVLERLYWNSYTRADSLWPGQGAYALRTVHQPFNFDPRINVLTVEASDLAGAQAGVAELVKRLPAGPDCALTAPLLLVSNRKPMTEAQSQALPKLDGDRDLWCRFHEATRSYRDSGDPAWAQRAKQALQAAIARVQQDPGFHITWPEETTSAGIGSMWDVIEEAPLWTDAERLEAENALFACMLSLPRHVSYWGTFAKNDTVLFNHSTFPLIGIYWIARYLDRYHPDQTATVKAYLEQVDGAFRGQVKSWKPQCDADGYQTIVPRHTIEYTLSRNDYSYFETGQVRQFAEMMTGVCDNRGAVSGFGDSAYYTSPGYEENGLPYALWYYKDGRYLWRLQQIRDGKWQNPYDPTVKPVEWQEMVGLTVWPMAPEFYRWMENSPSYDEAKVPLNVALAQAFDKVTFRENWDKGGQYLLLDGIARGKHLHFDGNAITKYYADGEDWLIDGDYLVRNTTDHTMVSVLRNGRCDQLIPPLTALDTAADFANCAFTRTTVRGYNGADWTRDLLWLKGLGFVVVDELTARETGEFMFEAIFKSLRLGRQDLQGGRVFSTLRPTDGGAGSRGLIPALDPVPGVARAARFANPDSRLEFPLTLPAGQYALTIYAQAKDGGTDSLFVQVDDAEPLAFHIPIEKLGPSSSAWTKDVPTPNLTVARGGDHRFRVTLREGPGIIVQKLVFANAQGQEVATIDPLSPPPLRPEQIKTAPDKRFFIKNDGQASLSVSDRLNNVNLKLRYLRERAGGQLKAGATRTFVNLFYNDRSDRPRDLDVRRAADGTVLLYRGGKLDGVLRRVKAGPTVYLTPTRTALFGFTGDASLKFARPCSLEINPRDGAATVYAPAATTVSFQGRTQAVPRGRSPLSLKGWAGLKRLPSFAAFAAQAGKPGPLPKPAASAAAAVPALPVAWQTPVARTEEGPAVINRLLPFDVNGDGVQELLVARGAQCVCLDASGKQLWAADAEDRVNDICVGDLERDGKLEVTFGSDDENFYVCDTTGRVLSQTHVDTLLKVGTSSVRDPRVSNVAIADLDNDGQTDLIIGTRNGNLCRYDAGLKRLWAVDTIEHGTFRMQLLDVDHDGQLDILASNRYGAVEIFNAKGRQLGSPYSELGDVVFAAADLDGDKEYEIVNGSSTGACAVSRVTGKPLFRFDNFGYGVTAVAAADVNGDGRAEAILASETGYVYVVDGTGKTLATKALGNAVLALATVGEGAGTRIAAGTRGGRVFLLDGKLQVQQTAAGAGPVTWLTVMSGAGGKQQLVAAAGEQLRGLGL